jgi:hypothetical protein
MHLGRLLLAAVFLSSLPAFAQNLDLIGKQGADAQRAPDFRTPPAATTSEPWRIIPKRHKDDTMVKRGQDVGSDGILVSPGGPLAADTTCYTIRAYVVARDSKDSDSVHPVGYSTCHPSSHYRLKTAEARP